MSMWNFPSSNLILTLAKCIQNTQIGITWSSKTWPGRKKWSGNLGGRDSGINQTCRSMMKVLTNSRRSKICKLSSIQLIFTIPKKRWWEASRHPSRSPGTPSEAARLPRTSKSLLLRTTATRWVGLKASHRANKSILGRAETVIIKVT